MNKIELKEQFEKVKPSYKKSIEIAVALLKQELDKTQVEVSAINSRVKTFESFFEKVGRKKYKAPFENMEDIAGIRIICYFPSELEVIENRIKESFNLVHSIDKSNPIDVDKFGYRSLHYVVCLKQESILNNSEKQLAENKIEIQLRTQLMHVWASIQGKLEYKKEEHSPKQFRRKLVQLSALLELADQQFQDLREEKERLREDLDKAGLMSYKYLELNIDSFFSFMEVCFPKRSFSYRYTKTLFIELRKLGISFEEIINGIDLTRNSLNQIEEDLEGNKNKWTRVATLKVILEITNERYWQSRNTVERESAKGIKKAKWRGILLNK